MPSPKTVVLGLDGAHFELIQPWLNDGKLPNIQSAIESGVSSDLESVLPPVTSPNWKAYATGKNPGKLGIFWWENIDIEERRVHYPSDRKNAHQEFWEIIGQKGGAGVIGVPTTYPPKSVNGFFVSGAPDADGTGYTSPSSLEVKLEQDFDYSVTKRNRISVNRKAAVDEILDLIDSRFTVGRALAEEHDISFLQMTTFYLNSLHHFLWDDDATLQGWQIVDKHVGELLDTNTNVVLMSDHGSTEITTVFNVNTWLERRGYLSLDAGISDYLYKAGITTDRLIRLAYLLRIPRLAERLAPERLLRQLPNDQGELQRESKTDGVDWEHSEAIASGQGPVYLTLSPDEDEYESLRTEIIEELGQLRDSSGRPIANRVVRGEEIYSGRYLDEAPDIVIDQKPGIHIAGSIGRSEVFSTPDEDDWRAENKQQGLFIAAGPDFGGSPPEELSILDLAPLFLHLHNCAIPSDMDGDVPMEVFAEGSSPKQRLVEYSDESSRAEEIQRIRAVAHNANF